MISAGSMSKKKYHAKQQFAATGQFLLCRFGKKTWLFEYHPGLKTKVCNKKIIFVFLNQNICCGYSIEP